jgi:hypothetical protein
LWVVNLPFATHCSYHFLVLCGSKLRKIICILVTCGKKALSTMWNCKLILNYYVTLFI